MRISDYDTISAARTGLFLIFADTVSGENYKMTIDSLSGQIANGKVLASQTGNFVTTSQTGEFYANTNPQQFISTGNGDIRYALASNTGSFLTAALTGSLTGSFLNNPFSDIGDMVYAIAGNIAERLPLGGANTVLHGGASIPAYSAVTEADITLANNSTNNVSTAKHGFMPILPDNANLFYNGQGNFATPSGIANAYYAQTFTGTSIAVNHNFGAYPVVQVVDAAGLVIAPTSITNNSVNALTVAFSADTTGQILATVGSPQLNSFISTSNDYTGVANDYIIKELSAGKTVTLINASGNLGKILVVKNASNGNIYVNTLLSQTIDGNPSITLASYDSLSAFSDGDNWNII